MTFPGLRRFFDPSAWRRLLHGDAGIEGRFHVETREGGKRRQVRDGKNIWTLTGREFTIELQSLAQASPRTTFRDDRIAYIGVGIGSQAEVADIESLVEPAAFQAGLYLAACVTPATFPASGTGTPNTAAQYIREYGTGEISLGMDVVLTEAGLFTDGDPNNDWNLGTFDDSTAEFGRAPMAYKTYEPITKTTSMTMRIVWEVRVV
jgi:hypothetical protein